MSVIGLEEIVKLRYLRTVKQNVNSRDAESDLGVDVDFGYATI